MWLGGSREGATVFEKIHPALSHLRLLSHLGLFEWEICHLFAENLIEAGFNALSRFVSKHCPQPRTRPEADPRRIPRAMTIRPGFQRTRSRGVIEQPGSNERIPRVSVGVSPVLL
jgi:hypothetical protein